MKVRFEDQCRAFGAWLDTNFGEMEIMVAIGEEGLIAYVRKGWRHRSSIPNEWDGLPVEVKYLGRVRPAS